ncbi:MAG: TonB-dependent receptor [Acidobacteria bacterium]|nr:TonB-dependent receptor [Acidobacteriota bacterium]
MRRFPLPLFLLIVFLTRAAIGQSPNGTISGLVLDPSGRAIVGAEILIVNDATGVRYPGTTNAEGIYAVPNLPPGPYRIQVSKIGFKTLIKPDVVLNVQSAVAINFTLPVGAFSETLTVTGGAPLVNTESGSVSTVIDRSLVESLPLNGRNFNTLLQLTPGVVIAQAASNNQGQFSVAGQRTSANNFLIDGVSANFGVAPTVALGTTGTGAAQAFSALGGTSSLISVEALQEFRIETSSFAPEFGRSPGGQVIFTTRSGTNNFHGGVYEFFRNDVLDANNWFANAAGEPRAAERYNNFGGYLGGPIVRGKTFFFASYEGSRLRQPSLQVIQVPSEYARSVADPTLLPFLAAYPRPDDRTVVPGSYTSQFTGSFSNPSTLNAGSVRLDHTFNERFSIFGRYNEAPSAVASRSNALSEIDSVDIKTRTFTVGSNMTLTSRLANTLRANYSLQKAGSVSSLDSLGGAIPPPVDVLTPAPLSPASTFASFFTFDTAVYQSGFNASNRNSQVNIADDVAWMRGSHRFRFGTDWRMILLDQKPYDAFLDYLANDVASFLSSGQVQFFAVSAKEAEYRIHAFSLYAQDTWSVTPRLTATYGVRWELSPAPAARGNTTLAAWRNVDNPDLLALAPPGTPLWSTTYGNFAPRLGIAYSLNQKGSLVLRAGWGIFYDLGAESAASLGSTFPNSASTFLDAVSVPLINPTSYLPPLNTQPPYQNAIGFSPNLKQPRSHQWNLAIEKAFGQEQALSFTYVGQAGRDLLRQEGIPQPNSNFAGDFSLTRNDAFSNYHALQVQFRRPVANRLHVLLNYTFSHSLDNASNDVQPLLSKDVISAANDYSSSDFDVRHNFSGAAVFEVPRAGHSGALAYATDGWSLEALVVARSGFPFNANLLTATIGGAFPRPDRVPGQPSWLADPLAPGNQRLNPDAFVIPPTLRQGTEGRNDIRGFGLSQVDLSVLRKFSFIDKLTLHFRVDAFNVLNHPNFRNPFGYVGFGPAFLQSTMMSNVGLGGLNPLFQQGGPRSLQLSLKLVF